MARVTILKLGGSVLTHKDADSAFNHACVQNAVSEIKRWLEEDSERRLIFVAGAGSFGHPLAKRYAIHQPSHDHKSAAGFLHLTTHMQSFGNQLAATFQAGGVPLFPIPSSSIFITDKGRIVHGALAAITQALEDSVVPFLWGDTVFDMSHRYRILSGDQIITYLVEKLTLHDLLFGTNVDGIFRDDPNKDPAAELIPYVDDSNYEDILAALGGSVYVDVTGGMAGKIAEIHAVKVRPVRCVIYNALVAGNTYRVLSGETLGTTLAFNAPLPTAD